LSQDISLNRLKQKARYISDALLKAFGKPQWKQAEPLDELVCTILSQNTNDRNRDLAFQTLKERFPTWHQVQNAPQEELIAAIRTAGLGNQKGWNIQSLLKQISAERGNLDLEFLREMPVDEARRWLTNFKGVGPKTAAIVLLFAFGKPAFPVDTHIQRVSGRLGLRPATMTREGAHVHLEKLSHLRPMGQFI